MPRVIWALSLLQFSKPVAISQDAWLMKSSYSALQYKTGHKYANYAATHSLIQDEKTRACPKTSGMQEE